MDESIQTKVCTKCGVKKALDQFYPSKAGRLGRRADCRECKRARDFAKWSAVRDETRAAKAAERAAASGDVVKKCMDCNRTLPILEFYALRKAPDGRHPRCRECFIEKRRRRRGMTPEDKAAEIEALRNRATKPCGACGEERPREAFRSRKASRDGLAPKCLDCEREWQRQHYEKVRELRLEQSREWYEANRDRKAEVARAWRESNRDRCNEYNHRRRARIYRTDSSDGIDLEALWTGFCALCDGPMDPAERWPDPLSPSVDHIVPLSRGGKHEQRNLQWAHLRCNISKGARPPGTVEEVA